MKTYLNTGRRVSGKAIKNYKECVSPLSSDRPHLKHYMQGKGRLFVNETEIIAFIAQTALTYIFVSVSTNNASKQTIIDQKQDLRTTKEDLMSEMKDTRESLLRESEVSTMSIIDIIKAEIQKEIEHSKAMKNDKQS